jgi:hypothetical protein
MQRWARRLRKARGAVGHAVGARYHDMGRLPPRAPEAVRLAGGGSCP